VAGPDRGKTAAAKELPDAVAVMDPFHVARLAGDALDLCRRRVQEARHGHRGRNGDPLYNSRRTLHTGADLLTDKQAARLRKLFASDAATPSIRHSRMSACQIGKAREAALQPAAISPSAGLPASGQPGFRSETPRWTVVHVRNERLAGGTPP
jgi:transposase